MVNITGTDKAVVDLFRKIGRLKGMDDLSSRITGILFIEPEPVSMEDLADKTGYSLASISNRIKLMEPLDIIQRKCRPGSRKCYLYMEKDFADLMRRQLNKIRNDSVNLIQEKMPAIIKEYREKSDDKSRKKAKILNNYYNHVTSFSRVLDKLMAELENIK